MTHLSIKYTNMGGGGVCGYRAEWKEKGSALKDSRQESTGKALSLSFPGNEQTRHSSIKEKTSYILYVYYLLSDLKGKKKKASATFPSLYWRENELRRRRTKPTDTKKKGWSIENPTGKKEGGCFERQAARGGGKKAAGSALTKKKEKSVSCTCHGCLRRKKKGRNFDAVPGGGRRQDAETRSTFRGGG